MKIEFEVSLFGKVNAQGEPEAYKKVELIELDKLSKETTLGELESHLSNLFEKVEKDNNNPKQSLGKITIRAKKENGVIIYLG